MAYTYMAFRFLEAGVEVQFYQKDYKSKAIWTVVGLKWLWLSCQLTGQFMAQWNFAHYLIARNVERQPVDVYTPPYNRSVWWQNANCYTIFVADIVLLIALILIKTQNVLKRNPNTIMLFTVSFILLAEVSAGITLNILVSNQKLDDMVLISLDMLMNYIKIGVQCLLCLVMLRILYVEKRQEMFFNKHLNLLNLEDSNMTSQECEGGLLDKDSLERAAIEREKAALVPSFEDSGIWQQGSFVGTGHQSEFLYGSNMAASQRSNMSNQMS